MNFFANRVCTLKFKMCWKFILLLAGVRQYHIIQKSRPDPQEQVTPGYLMMVQGRNPLESGQCFLPKNCFKECLPMQNPCRNPLKSGQCFLLKINEDGVFCYYVAIPSNRVNVSYAEHRFTTSTQKTFGVAIPSNRVNVSYGKSVGGSPWFKWRPRGRNPLKSGQCFLPDQEASKNEASQNTSWSQSPQIGSMFPTWGGLNENFEF